MKIPSFPAFASIALEFRDELHPHFQKLESGISEFTFAGIYLFRNTYQYKVSYLGEGEQGPLFALSGIKNGLKFFALPWGLPDFEIFSALLNSHDFLKGFSLSQVDQYRSTLESWGIDIHPDRDNWDYLYDATEMAELAGKKFHKKRNLIHQFESEYGPIRMEDINRSNEKGAREILELWGQLHNEPGDLVASREALELSETLELSGAIFCVGTQVVGYTLGEPLGSTGYVIHFEKANPAYKGVYQALFQSWAERLKETYSIINREQDLGDPGLKQAKETYRPIGFAEKYVLRRIEATKM